MIIGVTGKSGVGKTTYAKDYANSFGYSYLNIDEVGHEVLDDPEVRAQIKEKFNIDASSCDRKKLGELVFTNRNNEMKQLSEITWEKMKLIIDKRIESSKQGIVLDWILLPHTHYFKMCDKKILIKLNDDERKRRVMRRDNLTEEELKLRDNASIEYNDADFDTIINME